MVQALSIEAGDVEGQVLLPERSVHKKAKRYPGTTQEERQRGPAVVFIDGISGTFSPSQEKPKLEQKNRQFAPLALAVLKGTTVEFPNRDPEHHNVFSRSSAREFDLGRYGQDQSEEVTFDKAGIVRLRCEVHSHMHAVIVVLENPFFAVTDGEGNFTIPKVPPGKYRIYAFHEDYEGKDKVGDPLRAVGKEIEVTEEGTVRVEFNLRD
jgi:plastocyanin